MVQNTTFTKAANVDPAYHYFHLPNLVRLREGVGQICEVSGRAKAPRKDLSECLNKEVTH